MIRPEQQVSPEMLQEVWRARDRMPRRIKALTGFEVGNEHDVPGAIALVVSSDAGAPEDSGTEFVLSRQAALHLIAALAAGVAAKGG